MTMGQGVTEQNTGHDELLASAAARYDVDVEVLKKLLALERSFPDFSQFGSKAQFARAVAAVLDAKAKAAN